MFTNERFDEIIEILKEHKHIDVKTLSKMLYVSEATIRRDLNEMKTLGLIVRNHGGAILPENVDEVSIFVRMNENAHDKELAASNALHFIPEFRSVFIDSSSTALALATRMDLSFKTVVTNNLQTAIQLSKKPNINLISLGGNIHYNTISSTGSFTLRQLEDFSFDLMILSCTAVANKDIFENSLEQKELKLAALKRSKTKLLIFDHNKYTAHATYRLGSLSDFDIVVNDLECANIHSKTND